MWLRLVLGLTCICADEMCLRGMCWQHEAACIRKLCQYSSLLGVAPSCAFLRTAQPGTAVQHPFSWVSRLQSMTI